MGFGDTKPSKVYFDGCQIDHVLEYKYLGNIIKSTRRVKDGAFGDNYKHRCDLARKALFGMYKKTSKIGKNPPGIKLHMFDAMIEPILVYGSDARGTNKAAHLAVDKVFLHFARCILCVKATSSNAIFLVKLVTFPQACRAWHQH